MALQTPGTPGTPAMRRNDDSWISRFLKLDQNSFLCRVSDSYLDDNFELYELDHMVLNYKHALTLLRNKQKEDYTQHLPTEQQRTIESNTAILYGLIHSRFIITKKGLKKMRQKYIRKHFGVCHRSDCNLQPLLPMGITDETAQEFVRLYCSNCNEVYFPTKQFHKNMDGAYFGTTFAHLFLLLFPTFKPQQKPGPIKRRQYRPKIFGFELHETWHNIALREWNEKYHPNELEFKEKISVSQNDADAENEKKYLMQLKGKQQAEIVRLGQIVEKQQTEIKTVNALNKKQSIQLLALRTMSQQKSLTSAPLPLPLMPLIPSPIAITNNDDKKEWEQDLGFKDILEQLNKRISVLKNKYAQRKTHGIKPIKGKDLETYRNELDEICKVSNSFKLDVNQLANGI